MTSPRRDSSDAQSGRTENQPGQAQTVTAAAPKPVLCFVGGCDLRLFGLTPRERLIRQFGRAGVTSVISPEEAQRHQGPVIIARADALIDQPVVEYLAKNSGLVLLAGSESDGVLAAHVVGADAAAVTDLLMNGGQQGALPQGLVQAAPKDLDLTFWSALRKREVPYALRVTAANARAMEWRMFMGTYKGATDFITKHLWPVPAYHVTRLIAPLGITPNMVTTVGAVMVVAAFFLFLNGHYGTGLICAWLMTFLDTVDGKLARVSLTSSKWGDIFDHGIDLIHPPFWYIAWGLGLEAYGKPMTDSALTWSLVAIFGGYVLQRLMEGAAIKWLGLEIHIWRPIDTFFRQITARRNPNLVLLTLSALVGRPDLGLVAVAWWTIICLVLHGIQLAQGFAAARRGPLVSWMRKPVGAQ